MSLSTRIRFRVGMNKADRRSVLGSGFEPERGETRSPRARRRRLLTLEPLESKTVPSAGLVATAGISPAAEVASHVSTPRQLRLAKIETLAKLAYIWGLPAEFVYRFSNYNQLVTAPINTFAYGQAPAAWNNASTNAGDSSVLYINAELDLTRTALVYTIPPTNADFQVTQIFDNFINVVSDPGTRTLPTNRPDLVPFGRTQLTLCAKDECDAQGFYLPGHRTRYESRRDAHSPPCRHPGTGVEPEFGQQRL